MNVQVILVFAVQMVVVRILAVLQVILFQRFSFSHQLTQNMTTDSSLNYEFSTYCVVYIILFWMSKKNQFYVHNMLWSFLVHTELLIQRTIYCHILG